MVRKFRPGSWSIGVLAASLALSSLGVAGCGTSTAAGLEVIVQTDLASSQYSSIWVHVEQQTPSGSFRALVNQPLGSVFPARFGVEPGSSPDQDVLISVTAYAGAGSADGGPGTPVVVRTEQVQVPTTYVAQLDIELSANPGSCTGGTFVQATANTPTTCTINLLDAGMLPTFVAGDNGFDAGPTSDGHVRVDAGHDATRDGKSDGGPDATLDASGDAIAALPDATREAGADGSSDAAGPGCVIGGASYASGATNGSNSCQVCAPMVSTSAWTNASEGTACGGSGSGDLCHLGGCTSGCEIDGVYYTPGSIEPNSSCETCAPTSSTSSWTALDDGAMCGNGQTCAAGSCGSGCTIGTSTVPAGGVNPMNACQSCQPGTSTTAYSDNVDGSPCGTNEVCDNGTCAGGCYIAGTFYGPGAHNAANACQTCQPAVSTSAWSADSSVDGTSCGAGEVCNAGACVADCYVSSTLYASGAPNPANACQSCQPGTSTTGFTPNGAANGASCGPGDVCNSGACASGCYVNGSYYASGAANPTNACQSCQPAASTSGFTNVAGSPSCGGGQVCNAGQCGTGCSIGGMAYASGAANPTDACQSCQPGTSTTTWTNATNGTPCGAGLICAAGACAADCIIGGTIYTNNTANPTNACQSCQPSTSNTSFSTTPTSDGTTCGPGEVCTAGSCVGDCDIGGMFYASGTVNPANSCQSCQPATSTSTWTANASANGSTCGTNEVCTGGMCLTGCYIGGTFYMPPATNPMNACQTCQPGASLTSWTNASDGTSCGNGQICKGGTCGADCDIGAMIYASGAQNPNDACQTCQPGSNTTQWTNGATGTSCGTGLVCTSTGACAADCFIGGTIYTSGQVNPSSACQVCDPSSSTTSWSATTGGGACGAAGTCSGASCSTTFAYTGATQAFLVPAGVTTIKILATGASSGGGMAASLAATLPVTPGEMLAVNVGGIGTTASGGFNGGGMGGKGGAGAAAGIGGGGASDVRNGATYLVVAGGGGGGLLGGAGGRPNGTAGMNASGMLVGGGGGTQTVGGAGGVPGGATAAPGLPGSSGMGGAGGLASGAGGGGGGGGGGYYGGGGGGGDTTADGRGGGGGSSYVSPSATNPFFSTIADPGGAQPGSVTISY